MKFPTQIYGDIEKDNLYISVFLTNRCNYKCWYCYNKKEQYLDINMDDLLNFIGRMRIKDNRPIHISTLGGEPTLHPDIMKLSECISLLPNSKLSLITNFSKPIEFFKQLVMNKTYITVSYHSEFNKPQEFIDKILEINDSGFLKDIIVMINPNDFDSCVEVYKQLTELCPKVNVEMNKVENYTYTQEQNKIFDSNTNPKFYHLKYNDGTEELISFDEISNSDIQNFYNWVCNAGKDHLYIHNTGNIYNCESYYNRDLEPIGNIKNDFSLLKNPVLCKCKSCSGDYHVFKRSIYDKN